MIKRISMILIFTLLIVFCGPVYSLNTSSKILEKYTSKEFKNNKLNKLIDYYLLKNSIINSLENNCQVYDFPVSNLEKLEFD